MLQRISSKEQSQLKVPRPLTSNIDRYNAIPEKNVEIPERLGARWRPDEVSPVESSRNAKHGPPVSLEIACCQNGKNGQSIERETNGSTTMIASLYSSLMTVSIGWNDFHQTPPYKITIYSFASYS